MTGIRFYKGSGNNGTHIGLLYSSTGAALAQATFSGETASGWQLVTFSSPVAISANTIHLAWTDSSNNEDSFVVERSTTADPTNFVVASTVGQNVTSFDDSLPSPGVYYYRVKATNTTAYSSSNYSNQAVADSFASVTVKEPDQATTMNILEDSALTLEARSKLLVTYDAVRESPERRNRKVHSRWHRGGCTCG